MKLEIDSHRLASELDALAAFSDAPAPAVTRVVFTPTDLAARAFLKNLCRDAGLEIREDAIGNTFARWPGTEPHLPAIGTGSHTDAIPHSGRYDGTVGVLGGLEALRALRRAGFQPRRSLELLIFTSEEPTRFGIGCLGSRMIAGTLAADAARRLADRDGRGLEDVRTAAGFSGPLESVCLPPHYYEAFLELHIEQGPLLEKHGIPLGIVTAIAAPAGLRVTVEGEGGHAGAVLMPYRRDAFLAAAEIALAVEAAAISTGAIDTVGTTGVCDVFPGLVNGIPSRTRLEIDVRDIDEARRDHVLHTIHAACREIAARRKVTVHSETVNADAPTECGPAALEALTTACHSAGLPFQKMVSRAYHDSSFIGRIAPVAMLFIPCRNGVSHRPDEFASTEDIARGTQILAQTLANLSQ